jgi:3'-phosphoadenosine 5'-phosphosulfate sulfotransferase (PAPS reductase)/FAD synthetase
MPAPKIKQDKRNYRKHSDKNKEIIKNSLVNYGAGRSILIDSENEIIAGNGVMEQAEALNIPVKIIESDGSELIVVKRTDLKTEDKKRKELALIDNHSSDMSEFDFELVKSDFEAKFLDNINLNLDFSIIESKEETTKEGILKKLKPSIPDKEIDAFLETREKIYVAYSGGKDSGATLFELLKKEQFRHKIEVLFVETGAELPDVRFFIEKTVKLLNLPLTILKPEKDFYELFIRKGVWPHSLNKDCITELINKPCDKYTKEQGFIHVLARGGRPDQSQSKNKEQNKKLYEYAKDKWLYNNLYDLDKETYANLLQTIPKWEGYNRGYVRTACWCCPFQRGVQWDAMKENHPLSWECMKELTTKMQWNGVKKDGNEAMYNKYWGIKKEKNI